MRATIHEQPVSTWCADLVDALVEKIREPAGGGAHVIEVVPLWGAFARAPEFPSALREGAVGPAVDLGPAAWWTDASEDDDHDRWVGEVIETIRRIGPAAGGRHPSSVGATLDQDGVRHLYGDRFERLRQLKRHWDPDNRFRGSHNIPPAER